MRKAAASLAQLHSEAELAKVRLLSLRAEVTEAELHLADVQTQLLEANHKLMMAAMRLNRAAGSAITDLSVLEHAGHKAKLASHSSPAKASPARGSYLGDLREANERLILEAMLTHERAEQVDEGQRKQIEFLAVVTHELRNAASLLTHPNLERDKLEQLQASIHRQVEHMSRLIGDLLDGSRAAIGKFHLHKSLLDLRVAIEQAVENARPAIERRGQKIAVHIPPNVPLSVCGDATRLTQIFGNLLDNASKYTSESGEMALRVRVDDAQIYVTVSDTGIGINREALPKVFNLFMQDVPATEWHKEGLGIGLAVVRELIAAHGGTVEAHSAGSGLGSEFVVSLPLHLAADPALPLDPEPAVAADRCALGATAQAPALPWT